MSENHVQVLLYTSYLHIIGGIETFVMNFLELMADDYEIAVLCPRLPMEMANRIKQKARLIQHQESISCDNLIMVRQMDEIPFYVTYKKSFRMCHAYKSNPTWTIKQDCDKIIHVSKASKSSFQSDGNVIYNPLIKTSKKSLLLVSATRIPALDKGKNADRMLQLAKKLHNANIPFLWLNFSDQPLQNAPKGFMNVGAFQDIQPFIEKADYLVQLSDQEGFGYSVLEALINNTAVICTPFETTKELAVIDGKNGYIIPYDLDFDVNMLLEVPEFEYFYDNDIIKRKWKKLLDAKPPKRKELKPEDPVKVQVLKPYLDIALDKKLNTNQVVEMTLERAQYIQERGYVRIL